jgi:phosphoribosyl-AMP cyclohydrolase
MSSGLDETATFQPRFDASGLITAIVTDVRDGAVLMVAHMNAEALR